MHAAGRHLVWVTVVVVGSWTFSTACAPEPLNRQAPHSDTPAASTSTPPQARSPIYEGAHDIANCDQILGWAWNANDPSQRVQVEVYADGKLLTSATADELREDLARVGKGDGRHGFTIATPHALWDGATHSIRIGVARSSFELWETPRELTCR